MSDWRGERQGYRVNLFKGNETGVGQVPGGDTTHVGNSAGESNILDLSMFAAIDLDHGWYTVTLEAESDSECDKKNNGSSSDPCSFFIPRSPETRPSTGPETRPSTGPETLTNTGKSWTALFLTRSYT